MKKLPWGLANTDTAQTIPKWHRVSAMCRIVCEWNIHPVSIDVGAGYSGKNRLYYM
jgi:hypothetical protein